MTVTLYLGRNNYFAESSVSAVKTVPAKHFVNSKVHKQQQSSSQSLQQNARKSFPLLQKQFAEESELYKLQNYC